MNKFKRFLGLFALILSLYTEGSFAQGITSSDGAKLVIGNGSFVVVTTNGLLQSGTNTALTNDGTLITDGTVANATNATMSGNGSYKVGGNWSNTAAFTAGTSTVELTGSTVTTVNSGANPFYNLTLNKGASAIVNLLTNNATVTNALTFTGAANKLQLGTLNLTVNNSVVSYDATKYIITDGTGKLIAATVNATAFTFPIGSSSTSYTPLSISQSGTALSLSARVQNQVLSLGTTGSPITGVVNKSWVVTEESPTVIKSLTIIPQWLNSDQLSGFDNNKCGVSRWNGTNWDLTAANVGPRIGANPYTRTRSGITDVGLFAVGSKTVATFVQLSAKVFLQGPYSGSVMTDGLRTGGVNGTNLIPTLDVGNTTTTQGTQPNGFMHQGFGGGEITVSSNQGSVFSTQTITNDNIVDWIYVELRDPSVSSTVLHTRAALLQKDGDIVNEDGTSPLKIYGVPDGNYYISIKHRNHIAVRSATTKSLSQAATTVMDFTTTLSEALPTLATAGYNALASVAGGKFALWGGNANSDGSTRRTGSSTTSDYTIFVNYLGTLATISNVYRREDFNMDGSVRRTGSATTSDYSKFTTILSNNAIITQPTF
jgi:hypothetical protein